MLDVLRAEEPVTELRPGCGLVAGAVLPSTAGLLSSGCPASGTPYRIDGVHGSVVGGVSRNTRPVQIPAQGPQTVTIFPGGGAFMSAVIRPV